METHSLYFSAEVNATTAAMDCKVVNCSGLCIYDACFEAPPPISTPVSLDHHHPDRLLVSLLIAAGSLLAAAFFLLLTLYFFLHHRRRRRRRQANQNPPNQNPDDNGDGDLSEEEERDHHVWHIRTVGLEESTIKSIAAWVYKAGDGLIDGSDCSVCLGEFRDGELVRLLPKCSHAFHLPCIDTWLRSHVNCPLCRAPILSPAAIAAAVAVAVADPPPDSSGAAAGNPMDLESNSSVPVETAQIGIQPSDDDRSAPEEEKVDGVPETGAGIGIGVVIDPVAGPSSELPSDLGEDGLQPVRRSVSMDASSLGALLLRVDSGDKLGEEDKKEFESQEGRIAKNRGKQGNVSKGAAMRKGPSDMERSLSSRSGRFFFGRYGRARNSVLPL